MKDIKRTVSTGFWNDDMVLNDFTPEDRFFMLYLLTNPYTTQLGIYHLPIKKAALELGYSQESVSVLLDRFENKYGIIKYNKSTSEVAIKNYLKHSIVKGGKPVLDCLEKDAGLIKDKSLLKYVLGHIETESDTFDINKTVMEFIDKYKNDNDNDNERYVHESSTNRGKAEKNVIPPTVDMVRKYCQERGNNIDAENFVDFYTSKNWFVGKDKMKDWQASVRTWERRDKPQKSNAVDWDSL